MRSLGAGAHVPRRRGGLAAVSLALLALCAPGGATAVQTAGATTSPVRIESSEGGPEPRVQRRSGDLVSIFTGSIHVPADERRDGSIICVGGDVVVEGEVTRDVVVVLGTLRLSAPVGGNVVGVLSELELRDTVIDGELVNVLGGLRRDNVSVDGQVFNIGFPGNWFPGFWTLLSWMRVLGILLSFVLIVLLVALLPERVARIADEAPLRYVSAFFVGLLGYVALCVVLTLVSLTLIALPVAYLAYLALKWLGVAGLFYALGRRIGRSVGRELSPLGAVLLVYGVYAALLLGLSALGWVGFVSIVLVRLLFFCLFEIPALGLLLLTRAGTRGSADRTSSAIPDVPHATPGGAGAAPRAP